MSDMERNPRPRDFYDGVWRAKVVDADDPEERGRVRVNVIGVHVSSMEPEFLPWAEIIGQTGRKSGYFYNYDVDDTVFVMFEQGNRANPVVLGGWLGAPRGVSDLPPEATSDYANDRQRTLFMDRASNVIEMSAVPDEQQIRVRSGRSEIIISKTDDSLILNARGPVEVRGNKLSAFADQIDLQGGNTTIVANNATAGVPDGQLSIVSNQKINLYAAAIPGIDPLATIDMGQALDGSGVARQTSEMSLEASEVNIGTQAPPKLPTLNVNIQATGNVNIIGSAKVSISSLTIAEIIAAQIALKDPTGTLPLSGIVCQLHQCAFTGLPHPAGSSIAQAAF